MPLTLGDQVYEKYPKVALELDPKFSQDLPD